KKKSIYLKQITIIIVNKNLHSLVALFKESKFNKKKAIFLVAVILLSLIIVSKMTLNDEKEKFVEKGTTDGLSRALLKNGIFQNPWDTWKKPEMSGLLRWGLFHKDNTKLPSDNTILDNNLPVHLTSDEEIKKFCEEDTTNKIKIIWIGHSTSLINFENKIIIMDPVFSERASPFAFAGPKRFRPVPMTIDKIPKLDAVVISHNHFDHLDYKSVLSLHEKFGKNEANPLNWFVGQGTGEWFKSCGIVKNVHELLWWESKNFKDLEFVFTPAQHWSSRGGFTENKALWGGWVILGKSKKVYFAGDSGYCPAFKEIGQKYGPLDYSFIPIGAYEPRWFMGPQHVDPEEAVKIHMDVKSNKSFAIHWGTFALASEYYMEPKEKLDEMLDKYSVDKNNFITLRHGDLNEFE
ncbi:unnamed protein product, partial [Brachionus calyciflorus]